ncbi:DUF4232 domain-containing protein [Nonomuraea sp. NPDC050536]|uniref:DUF4232 domain-containing protein n=1 Tax=Nonomuraea sp. NPDC050536 TaxID=3364366 RepID=UPI0037C87D13
MKKFQIAALAAGLLLAGGAAPALAQESASVHRCGTAQLQVTLGHVDAGAGNRYAPLVFTNRSGTTCTLYGYPGLIMIDKQGDALRTRVRREPGPRHTVTVKPGRSASAIVHWTVIQVGSETTCPAPYRLMVIPPDETAHREIPFDVGQVCDTGRLGIQPLK